MLLVVTVACVVYGWMPEHAHRAALEARAAAAEATLLDRGRIGEASTSAADAVAEGKRRLGAAVPLAGPAADQRLAVDLVNLSRESGVRWVSLSAPTPAPLTTPKPIPAPSVAASASAHDAAGAQSQVWASGRSSSPDADVPAPPQGVADVATLSLLGLQPMERVVVIGGSQDGLVRWLDGLGSIGSIVQVRAISFGAAQNVRDGVDATIKIAVLERIEQ